MSYQQSSVAIVIYRALLMKLTTKVKQVDRISFAALVLGGLESPVSKGQQCIYLSQHSGEPALGLQKELEARLRDKGVRPTRQRLEIGELLLAIPRHMSAEQILRELREKGSRLSKATVYNTLNLLSKEGIVREIAVDPERMFYDSTAHPHHHFYNVDTGELTDIDDPTVRITGLPELPQGTVESDVEIIIRVRNAAAV